MYSNHDLYRVIHKAVRALLSDLVAKAGRVDFTDAAQVAQLRADTAATMALLSSHAEHEHEFISPVIAKVAPEVGRKVDAAHDEQEEQIESLEIVLDSIDSNSPDAPWKGHVYLVRLSRFVGELLVHMADEEEQIMPALQSAMTEEQIAELHDALVSSVPPQEMAQWAEWMLPSINTPERAGLLGGMRAGAPPQVFAFFRELARRVLSPADDAALEARLNEAVLA